MDRQPLSSAQLDTIIAASLARPSRNIAGDLGPRCPACSGLGAFLALGSGDRVTRATTKCRCHGSGLDLEAIERADRELLWQQIHAIESTLGLPLTSRYQLPTITLSRQYWMECIAWATADGTAVANSTTEAIVMPNVTVPANYMQDGRLLRLTLYGRLSTTATPTIRFRVRWGGVSGTVLWDSGTITTATVTNALWAITDLLLQTRSNGATGTLFPTGIAMVGSAAPPSVGSATGAPAIGIFGSAGDDTPAAVTVDLTADTALAVTAQWSAASASNTATGHNYAIESAN